MINDGTITCTRGPSHDGRKQLYGIVVKRSDRSQASLKEAIIRKFGAEQRFYTCSASDMNAEELIVFLKQKGKFMPTETGFTVDITKKCDHK